MNAKPFVAAAAAASLALMLISGCSQQNDTIDQAERGDKNRPSAEEIKAIAEEGFIYGLPLVMNYAVNYEFWVDKTASQYKCPFNQIYNEHRVFTYKDTAVVTPNSDTPYSFVCLDLRAEPYVLSVPAFERERYYSLQLTDWNTFNIGYIGSRATGCDAGDYLVVPPDWKGQTPAGIKKVFRSTTQFALVIYRTQLLSPDDMPNVEKVQSGYKLNHCRPTCTSPPRQLPRSLISPRSIHSSPRRTSSSISISPSSSRRPLPRKTPFAPSWLASASVPASDSPSRRSASRTRSS